MISYTIADILLHIILISSFIVIFFFTYASKIEKQIVIRQSTDIVQDVIQSTTSVLPDIAIEELDKTLITQLQPPDMSTEDAEIDASNKDLLDRTVKTIGVVFAVGLLIVYMMSKIYKFSMTDLLVRNIIIVSFVAITEFSFLTYFAKNYDTIDSNFVKYKILQTINNRLK